MKHIVFDVDGTLINTETNLLRSLQDTVQILTGRVYTLKELLVYMGIPSRETMEQLGVEDIPRGIELWDEKAAAYAHLVESFPGIPEMLTWLRTRECRMGIVTSRSNVEFDGVVRPMGIHRYFDCIICSDDTQMHKPHPEPLLKYAERTGAAPEEMVYIGDSPHDMACARDAGVRFVLAGWGAGDKISGQPERAESPEQLLAMLGFSDG